jgi:hypothetical protein
MKKQKLCPKCGHPRSLCECYQFMEVEVRLGARRRTNREGNTVTVNDVPGVSVKYGVMSLDGKPLTYKGTPMTYQGFQFSRLPTLEAAERFAEFLNSDQIFDCVIPREFLTESGHAESRDAR